MAAARKDNLLSTVAKILGILVILGTAAAGVITVLGEYVYATKGEITKLEKEHVQAKERVKLRDYRIMKMEVQVQNMEGVAQRTDTNVEKLLTRFELQAAPMPISKPLPAPPVPDSLDTTD